MPVTGATYLQPLQACFKAGHLCGVMVVSSVDDYNVAQTHKPKMDDELPLSHSVCVVRVCEWEKVTEENGDQD